MNRTVAPFLLMLLSLLQVTTALARSDALIEQEIKAQIAGTEQLATSRIEVHVQQRLVVLTGEVRLYEHKLVSERIAWTTTGVFEVDNEIRVVPKIPVSDTAIERKIMEIVIASDRFRTAGVTVAVSDGKVLIKGNFLDFSDSTALRHKVAEIEGVIDIEMHAVFLAQSGRVSGSASDLNHKRNAGSEPLFSDAVLAHSDGPGSASFSARV